MRWAFSRLGAMFVKLGQVLSARADLLAPGVIAELRALQDHVAPFPFARARASIERELGVPIEQVFERLDPEPIAAGSIAQVHHGVLHSGEEVAVKVLRPEIRARVRRDARLVLWLAHLAHAVSARARAADVIGHARSLLAGVVLQTDLRREAENYRRFRDDFAGAAGLAFPRVVARYSTSGVLVMDFVRGVHLERIRPEHVPCVTRTLRTMFFAMCFDHGLVHADLHPGNLLVGADGTVTVLDVGLVKYLDAATIAKLVELSRCLVMGTADDLIAHLRDHHHHAPTTDWAAVTADAGPFVANLRRSSIAELELCAVVGQLFQLARKHGIRPMPELSLVLLGMVTIEGIAKQLDPTANTMAEVARYLGPRIARERRLARGSREWPLPPLVGPAPVVIAAPRSEPARSSVQAAAALPVVELRRRPATGHN